MHRLRSNQHNYSNTRPSLIVQREPRGPVSFPFSFIQMHRSIHMEV
jgi:hypothetical protein